MSAYFELSSHRRTIGVLLLYILLHVAVNRTECSCQDRPGQ
jgi:hypothetical protein